MCLPGMDPLVAVRPLHGERQHGRLGLEAGQLTGTLDTVGVEPPHEQSGARGRVQLGRNRVKLDEIFGQYRDRDRVTLGLETYF